MTARIRNNGDWYLADLVERSEYVGRDKSNANRRCLTWVNTVLIQAESPEAAYHKAIRIGKRYTTRYKAVAGNTVQWRCLGVAKLRWLEPDLEDGAELYHRDLGYISAKRSAALVRRKRELMTELLGS